MVISFNSFGVELLAVGLYVQRRRKYSLVRADARDERSWHRVTTRKRPTLLHRKMFLSIPPPPLFLLVRFLFSHKLKHAISALTTHNLLSHHFPYQLKVTGLLER